MSKGIERLKTILPANQNAMSRAKTAGDIPNISTEPCAETPAFDSHALEGAFRDQAGMSAEHLNLAASFVQQGQQEIRHFRQELQDSARQLSTLRMPDTRVNIEGIKMEVPFTLKQYAIDIDQNKYMKIMYALLGKERIDNFRGHATKSNQNNTPALWLNQAVWIESCKPYVYNIGKNLADHIKDGDADWTHVDDATDKQASDYLEMALGGELRGRLNQIAQSNSQPIFVIFIVLVDTLLRDRGEVAIPVTAGSLWDDPWKEGE